MRPVFTQETHDFNAVAGTSYLHQRNYEHFRIYITSLFHLTIERAYLAGQGCAVSASALLILGMSILDSIFQTCQPNSHKHYIQLEETPKPI